jgi:hypothetical protein
VVGILCVRAYPAGKCPMVGERSGVVPSRPGGARLSHDRQTPPLEEQRRRGPAGNRVSG